jgi:hypothetical protein
LPPYSYLFDRYFAQKCYRPAVRRDEVRRDEVLRDEKLRDDLLREDVVPLLFRLVAAAFLADLWRAAAPRLFAVERA